MIKTNINKKSRIFLTGHKGLVGSAVLRELKKQGYKKILVVSKKKLDLRNQNKVEAFFKKKKPEVVINAAATVGGIYANNKYKADFIFNNLAIQNNIIHSSFTNKVKQLVFLGSSCVYPRDCKQPIKETYLLNGKIEKTVKIARREISRPYIFKNNLYLIKNGQIIRYD